jgi:16S rRNA (guanine(966)-N(2))-methyltransferase RsmD
VRVIAGTARGLRLTAVPGTTTRPITDRVKTSLFNILGSRVVDARFLDLFAGTGSVGIEALSRGAAAATFVEKNARAVATIRRNLAITKLSRDATVVRRDVFRFVPEHSGSGYDLVHIAPPQYRDLWSRTLRALDASATVISEGTLVVAQIFPKEYADLDLCRLRLWDRRQYGSTLLCFYLTDSMPAGTVSA